MVSFGPRRRNQRPARINAASISFVLICVFLFVLWLFLFDRGDVVLFDYYESRFPSAVALHDTIGKKDDDDDMELAKQQSFGFFQDISSQEWERLRSIVKSRINNKHPGDPLRDSNKPNVWYQNNWEPDFSCRFERRVGMGLGDGPKWVCDPHRLSEQKKQQNKDCLVYSVGSNGDFGFEEGLQNVLGSRTICEIHTFDPSPRYADRVPQDKNISYHPWGLKSSYSDTIGPELIGKKTPGGDFLTLEETMRKLGHEGRTIDVFKIDCEGCEWVTVQDWIRVDIRQILVETHIVPPMANEFFETLQKAGYVTFHKEPNIMAGGGVCIEYAFLRLALNL